MWKWILGDWEGKQNNGCYCHCPGRDDGSLHEGGGGGLGRRGQVRICSEVESVRCVDVLDVESEEEGGVKEIPVSVNHD